MKSKRDLLPIIMSLADKYDMPAELDARFTQAAKDAGYYENQLMTAIRRRYEEKTDDREFMAVMMLLILLQLRRAYREGLREVDIDTWSVEYENDLDTFVYKEQQSLSRLLDDIKAAIAAGLGWMYFRWRMSLWANRYLDVTNRAMVTGGKRVGARLEWVLGATEKHCTDCGGYAGQVKTAQEWNDIYLTLGMKPQAHELECKGYNCDCRFRRVKR